MKSIKGTGAHKNHSSINRSFAFSTIHTGSFFCIVFNEKKIFNEKNFNETSTNILGVSLLVQPVETRPDLLKPVQICPDPLQPVETRFNPFRSVSPSYPLPLFPPFFLGGGREGEGRKHHHQKPPEGGGGRSPPSPSGF